VLLVLNVHPFPHQKSPKTTPRIQNHYRSIEIVFKSTKKKNTHPKKKNKSKKSVIPKKNPPPPVTTAFGSEAAAIGPPDLHGAGVAGGVQGDQVFPVLLGAPVAKNWETWRKWGKRWGDEEEST